MNVSSHNEFFYCSYTAKEAKISFNKSCKLIQATNAEVFHPPRIIPAPSISVAQMIREYLITLRKVISGAIEDILCHMGIFFSVDVYLSHIKQRKQKDQQEKNNLVA